MQSVGFEPDTVWTSDQMKKIKTLVTADDEPLFSVVCPLAYIIAEAGKTIEITIKNINQIVILFIGTSAVTYI